LYRLQSSRFFDVWFAMSFVDDFEEGDVEWDDAIDFAEVTETGSSASDVRCGSFPLV